MIKINHPEKHNKGWGYELWIHNSEKYCGKILHFNKGAKFSMHFHMQKTETWYVSKGCLKLECFDLKTAKREVRTILEGQTAHIKPGNPHKLGALENSDIFEVSTQHFEEDSYRIEPGDSQK